MACSTGDLLSSRGPIIGTPPEQLITTSEPEVFVDTTSDGHVYLLFRVTAPDSTFQLAWRPTNISIETDRGYQASVLLHPSACLEPAENGESFPFDFTWWSCNTVGINTNTVLTSARVAEIEDLVSASAVTTFVFKTMPGAQYLFEVPVGREATAEAVHRLTGLPEVTEAYPVDNDPVCVSSDIVPPPPCDPWWLIALKPFTYGPTPGDSVPVSHAGWVHVVYTQPDGVQRVSTYTFPP